jgi:C4-dicarboxylate transporter/malic acid transport protein
MTTDAAPIPTPQAAVGPDQAPAADTPVATVDRGGSGTRLRDLHPGWLASVMGTAIVAVASYDNPGNVTALRGVAHRLGVGLAVLAYALGAVLVVAYLIRWVHHSRAALADLRHPMLGAMHATLPGGLLVLAVMTSVIGPDLFPGAAVTPIIAVLAVAGSVLGLVISVAFAYTLFTGDHPAAAVNGGWFIPPVVTIIIPMALAPLMPHTSPGTARLLLALGYATLGMGFLLFLFTMGLLHDRLVLHPLPPAALAPTVWIALGPVGVGALVPVVLARAGQPVFGAVAPTITMISQLFATALWGFGLWWLAIATTLLVRYLRAGGLPFHLGWWAFTFPLGAYTVATLTLARAWQAPVLEALTALLYLALVGFWAVVTARTVAATRTGRIWQR